jgi:heme/copper-type cytochrome/quinol oxidase subunit 3
MSVAASLLHIGCIIGGPDWYRFFGAGEVLARAAERGSPVPAVMTAIIAAILAGWAAYAFSAAGLILRLPLIRTALVAIAVVLLARSSLAFVPAAWEPENRTIAFMFWTSFICFVMGMCFALGTWRAWPTLSLKRSR